MLVWALPSAVVALAVAVIWRRVYLRQPTRRVLPGLGIIAVPRRLETRAPRGDEGTPVFAFDRIAGGFSMMGSLTPVRERLSLMLLPPGVAADAGANLESGFGYLARDRIATPRWREEQGVFIGEGLHEVNAHETDAFVLLMALPSGDGLIGYMGWRKDIGLAAARRLLGEAAASFHREGQAMPERDADKGVRVATVPLPEELRGVEGPLEEAQSMIARLGAEPRFRGEQLPLLAARLEQAAEALGPTDPARGRWLYERAIDHWYGWGAMATSGGDGAARAPEIRAAERRHKAFLDRLPRSGG